MQCSDQCYGQSWIATRHASFAGVGRQTRPGFLSRDIRRHPPFSRGQGQPEHDPEKWQRFSKKIMLKQRDEIMIRFNLTGS
jgi:hypothetical protein